MDLISVLRDNGVTEFHLGELRLVLGPLPVPEGPVSAVSARDMRPATDEPRGAAAYQHPSLWGGGKPPVFE